MLCREEFKMALRIVFPRRGTVEVETFAPDALSDGSVRVRASYSLMSTGTEGIILHGLFDEGTHWAKWVSYPHRPGYSMVGVVEEVGHGVTDFAVGDRVAARVGHASEHVVDEQLCTRVPDDVPLAEASWFGLAKIALVGARAAGYALGDSVAVIGAGPIGQMSVRWAAAAGVRSVVAVDTVAARLELARAGGATDVVAVPIDDGQEEIIAACGGRRPCVVVDSTGNAAAFAGVLGLVADRGRVVLLGDTGSPASQHLTSDVVIRGLSIVGAHDRHTQADAGCDGERGLHELFFKLVSTGRFNLAGLNTHTFSPKDAQKAYEVAAQRRGDTMGIVFDWTKL
jgi:2-desacetyl-2-hydroxyethyl bacteriochlorophyllide A dehydrogenase